LAGKRRLAHTIRDLPAVGPGLVALRDAYRRARFPGSANHWESTYQSGGNSGPGSYGVLAQFKAGFLNDFVAREGVSTVLEFGCGDGNQLSLVEYPRYVGLDISPTAVNLCRAKFAEDDSKKFDVYRPNMGMRADLTLSLDVLFHLVEDAVFDSYLDDVFSSADRFVILFTSDSDRFRAPRQTPEVKHRPVPRIVRERFPDWQLVEERANPRPYDGDAMSSSFANFYVYARPVTG
jgi:SAM-dependent methyltransferase